MAWRMRSSIWNCLPNSFFRSAVSFRIGGTERKRRKGSRSSGE
eukprot:CAMPEP_0119026772 /NCGR_PEP_ID=MMETSP1176-20130426/36031_1 /TAXON_ID=265551 /ORGANISM="Synedropsis recta cf, Strain CCMP1620" /LENGTH=42 /DNA_ID= /DNA_START= /DNA_END= /DNA_ORIENTATION=